MASRNASPRAKIGCAVSLELNLEELKRRSNLESLRVFVQNEQCFPTQSDPSTSPITMEELKKLARAWKLHERRNFWKLNPDRDSMVNALLQYIEDNQKLAVSKSLTAASASGQYSPTAPIGSSRPSRTAPRLKNYCGMKHFFREVQPEEIVVHSRFIDAPETDGATIQLVNRWRGEDFNLKMEDNASSQGAVREKTIIPNIPGYNVDSMRQVRSELAKLIKHRNLAAHLARFSVSVDNKKQNINASGVQTFVTVAESNDPQVATYCLIGLCNLASCSYVRSIMLEINAVHKLTPLVPLLRGNNALWASHLLYYYFSIEQEIEDRIYNSSISLLQNAGTSYDLPTLSITLFTLSNLMPCLDRNRVAELILLIIYQRLLPSLCPREDIMKQNLEILLNICSFSNCHPTLIGHDVLEILSLFTNFAVRVNNSDIGLIVAKVLMSLLQLESSIQPVVVDFICIAIDLFSFDDEQVLKYCFRVITTLSANSSLLEYVCESDVIAVVTRTIDSNASLPMDVCKDAARYLSNICRPVSKDYARRLMDESVPISILKLIQAAHHKKEVSVQSIAVRGLQNLLSFRENCIEMASICFMPLLRMMKEHGNVGAALAIYNISCVAECENLLVQEKVHMKVLEFLTSASDVEVKSVYLKIMVQMSGNSVCIADMLQANMIRVLAIKIHDSSLTSIWPEVARMLLAVVVYRSSDPLPEEDIKGCLAILKRICCTKHASEQLLSTCSSILAFLSLQINEFEEVEVILRSILSMSSSDEVMESGSTVIYNITCAPLSNLATPVLLRDGTYLNIMIRMLRSGNARVQENITETIRTLCANPICIDLLLSIDLLSDLIVVALLRTSSENIKIVCNEAFYNMLCNNHTRLRLLRGDLWWAIMRLSRADSESIRKVCGKTLFDLSCDGANISALRDHHVLSFIRGVVCNTNGKGSVSGNAGQRGMEFLESCLKSVQNITQYFFSSGSIQHHEVSAIIAICFEVLSRSHSVMCIRTAVSLILKCSHMMLVETVSEAVNLEFDRILSESSSIWSLDAVTCVLVSQLLWELSCCQAFTKSVSISDLTPIITAAYSSNRCEEIAENLVCALLQYSKGGFSGSETQTLMAAPVMNHILCDTFAVPRVVTSAVKLSSGEEYVPTLSLEMFSLQQSVPSAGDGDARSEYSNSYSFSCRSAVLSLYVHCLDEAVKIPQTIPLILVQGILTLPHISHDNTRQNILTIISKFSLVAELSLHLLDSDIFRLLTQHLAFARKSNSTNSEKATVFCSSILYNLSLHRSVLPFLVAVAASGVDLLIKDILDQALPESCAPIVGFFYNCVYHCPLLVQYTLNPQFVLQTFIQMTSIFKQEQQLRINRYVVSIVLNKYDFGSTVDPLFVQSIFNEMQLYEDRPPPELDNMVFCGLDMTVMDSSVLLRQKNSTSVTIPTVPALPNKWKPIIIQNKKTMEHVIASMGLVEAVTHNSLECPEIFQISPFEKIVKEYDKVHIEPEVFSGEDLSLLEQDDDVDGSSDVV